MVVTDKNKFEIRRMLYAAFFPCILLLILWMMQLWEWNFQTNMHWMGVYPRTFSGLTGILTEPLVHANVNHLFSNSIPLLVMSWCLFYFYKDLGYLVFPFLWVLSGMFTWLIGRDSYHIGASGLIYALSLFLFFSGILRRYVPLMAVSLIVVFLYGSTVWSIFPVSEIVDPAISWEAHLSGAISGIICALVFRHQGPKAPDPVEVEEEDDDGENEEATSTAETGEHTE